MLGALKTLSFGKIKINRMSVGGSRGTRQQRKSIVRIDSTKPFGGKAHNLTSHVLRQPSRGGRSGTHPQLNKSAACMHAGDLHDMVRARTDAADARRCRSCFDRRLFAREGELQQAMISVDRASHGGEVAIDCSDS